MRSSQVSATLKNLVSKPKYEINSPLVVYVDIHVSSVRGVKSVETIPYARDDARW